MKDEKKILNEDLFFEVWSSTFLHGTIAACVCSGEAVIIEVNLKLKFESSIICPKDPISTIKPNLMVEIVHYLSFRTKEVPKNG